MGSIQVETQSEAPWHTAFPKPKSTAGSISREEVLMLLKLQKAGRDFLLIDVRRNDHEGGTISSSINLPAQSLYPSLATLHALSALNVKKVIFYCGSCNGRGPRAASWFKDYLIDNQINSPESLILEGGIKGWVKAGKDYTDLMDGYEPKAWA